MGPIRFLSFQQDICAILLLFEYHIASERTTFVGTVRE